MYSVLKSKPFSFTADDVVTLICSDDHKRIVNRGCLTRSSLYMRIVLGGVRAKEQVLRIEHENDMELFDDYLNHLHGCEFVSVLEPQEWHSLRIAKLYVLGERMLDVSFRNAVLAQWLHYGVGEDGDLRPLLHNDQCVTIIFGGTPEDSPARKFLLDVYTKYATSTWITAGLSVEFLNGLVRKVLGNRDSETRHEYEEAVAAGDWPVAIDLNVQNYMMPTKYWH